MAVTTIIKHLEFYGGRMGLQAPRLFFFGTPVKDTHLYLLIMVITGSMLIGAMKLIKTCRTVPCFLQYRALTQSSGQDSSIAQMDLSLKSPP
jgi:hypothetical protein